MHRAWQDAAIVKHSTASSVSTEASRQGQLDTAGVLRSNGRVPGENGLLGMCARHRLPQQAPEHTWPGCMQAYVLTDSSGRHLGQLPA